MYIKSVKRNRLCIALKCNVWSKENAIKFECILIKEKFKRSVFLSFAISFAALVCFILFFFNDKKMCSMCCSFFIASHLFITIFNCAYVWVAHVICQRIYHSGKEEAKKKQTK